MCLTPSIPQDNSGQQAQQAEQQRQNNITAAQGGIDSAFSGFNDDYFNNYQKSYTNAYDPLVDQQYNDARKSVSLALARTGNLNSSYGADELAKLDAADKTQMANVASNATTATNALKSNVQSNKSNLYGLAQTAGDPGTVAAQAPAIASTLDTPVAVSPLADLFSSFTNLASNAATAEQNGFYGTGTGLFAPPARPSTYINSV
jgi:hypothetical protein